MRKFDIASLEDLLPETVRQIALVIGFPATQQLIERFGGACFPVGRGNRQTGERRLELLRETIGEDNTRLLMQHFGGESSLVIPRCAVAFREWRNRCFLEDVDELVSKGESLRMALTLTAPRYGIANTWAWVILARRRSPPPASQGDLF
ncbi:TPA: hypothetical protein M4731_001401 [Salmonella enterica]|nr:hypothetical protein [Salmonella enterica]MCH5735381.1 hypothetical protein [Salmonella enterica]MCH5741815.1 hypothetical protein [Salmonella enterica]MCH5746913.1 hypothetical protein [Salmonella enterica]MCH5757095.1 hypothetical protein [Salmonella enterica]